MTTLYGITANGLVVSRRTKAQYDFGLVRDGRLIRCSWGLESLKKKGIRSGDMIVGFTTAPLKPHARRQTMFWHGLPPVTYPQCYACDNPGLGRSARWPAHLAKGPTEYVPACRTRHAQKEAS